MASWVFFVFFLSITTHAYATKPLGTECGYEYMLEGRSEIGGFSRPSKNLSEAPYPLEEIKTAFTSDHMKAMRTTLENMGMDLEPGREYLNDKDNAVQGYDQWKLDFDDAMKDPLLRRDAELFVLKYLQNAPPAGSEGDFYHPGLDEKSALPRHRTLDDYYSDDDCLKPLDTLANTLENYLEFRSVLDSDTYSSPERRSKTITQMRAAYMVSAVMRARRPKTNKYLDVGR